MVAKTTNPLFYLKLTDKHKIDLYHDICRGITIFLVIRFLLKKTFHDREWQLMIFHNIIGFLTYQIIINRFNYKSMLGGYYEVFDDIIKSITIITVSVYLGNSLDQKPTFTKDFFVKMVKLVGAVILYHALIQKHLRHFIERYFTGHTRYAVIVEDWIENIVIFAISQYFSGVPVTKDIWMKDVIYYMLGVIVYHMLVKNVI